MTQTFAPVPDLDDPATDPRDVARAAAHRLAELTGVQEHDVALVLGSGWSGAADLLGELDASLQARFSQEWRTAADADWKARHQREATPEQLAAFKAAQERHG